MRDPAPLVCQNLWKRLICLALLLAAVGFLPAAAQDMKTVSSHLAGRIATSGRKTVAVVDFTDLQGNVTELGRFLAEELSDQLVNDAKGFEVIDRTHLKTILQEHKLATTGLIDPQTARKLGQIAGVDALVTGTTTPLGDSVRLFVKVLDTETARMIASSATDVPRTKAIDELLGRGLNEGTPRPTAGESSGATKSGSESLRPVSVQDNDFLFLVRNCRKSGQGITCSGSVVNRAPKRRTLWLQTTYSAYMLDNLGNQYRYKQVVLGAEGNQQMLEPDLEMNFLLSATDIDPRATSVSLILSYGYQQQDPYHYEGSTNVTFKHIVLQQRQPQ